MSKSVFMLNNAQITYEVIDGEVVIINLKNGNYYSTDGSGAEIWNLLSRNPSRMSLENHLIHRYEGPASEIQASLDVFLEALHREELVIPGDDGSENMGDDPIPAAPRPNTNPPFSAPKLQIYSDMQDFLLLDPIHEVDDTGWPNKKANPETG